MGDGPKQDEVTRITNAIVAELGEADLESALTVVCNLAGQLIAAMSNGQPSLVQSHSNNMAENIKKAAITKLLYDDERRRAADEGQDATPTLDS